MLPALDKPGPIAIENAPLRKNICRQNCRIGKQFTNVTAVSDGVNSVKKTTHRKRNRRMPIRSRSHEKIARRKSSDSGALTDWMESEVWRRGENLVLSWSEIKLEPIFGNH
jgi:hypothetical protein